MHAELRVHEGQGLTEIQSVLDQGGYVSLCREDLDPWGYVSGQRLERVTVVDDNFLVRLRAGRVAMLPLAITKLDFSLFHKGQYEHRWELRVLFERTERGAFVRATVIDPSGDKLVCSLKPGEPLRRHNDRGGAESPGDRMLSMRHLGDGLGWMHQLQTDQEFAIPLARDVLEGMLSHGGLSITAKEWEEAQQSSESADPVPNGSGNS